MGFIDKVLKRKSPGPRVFILGLDGTPFALMKEMFSKGILKNLASIADQGSLLQMATTIPDVSSVAWTTFMTGVNPGRHGVFGFVDIRPGTYTTYFPNATNIQSPCFWHLIGKEKRRSVVVNMPGTYPAQELNGSLISGFVSLDLEKATFPKKLVPWLKAQGYMLDVDASKARAKEEGFFEELHASLEKRERTFHKLMKEEAWDFFAAIVTGTDRLHHFFWDAYEETGSPFHHAFIEYYRAVDEMAGRLYDDLNGKATFLAFSDHGFCRLRRDMYLNRWLEEQGFLTFKNEKRDSVADADPAGTRAFCLDPGRIYVNLEQRFPGGSVFPGKPYKDLVEELSAGLAEVTVTEKGGATEKVVRRVFRKDELYNGPCLTFAPDLIVLSEPGNNLKGATNKTEIFDTQGPFTGMHTQDDAFFLSDRPASSGLKDLHILDVTRTVVTLLGASSVGSIEGRSIFTA